MAAPRIFDIQRFSLHDGEGIRTTVFFKGCPLRCLWCHNPESWSFEEEIMRYPERCIGCGCCDEGCVSGARVRVGEVYEIDALARLLLRDRPFFDESGGGVTFSGGEALAQDMGYMEELASRLVRAGVSVDIDTCGFAPYGHFERMLPWTDTFLYDLKAVDPALHRRLTGQDNALILENLARLVRAGARVALRVPVVPGAQDMRELGAIARFARDTCPRSRVHLLPYHRLGSEKRERLQMDAAAAFATPDDAYMNKVAALFRETGVGAITIGG